MLKLIQQIWIPPILKYNKINCLVINEIELRHEMRDKVSDVTFQQKLQNKININKIVITRGKLCNTNR